MSAQGTEAAALELIVKDEIAVAVGNAPGASRNVFVVYGHDTKARTQLEAMLRRWQLEPLILDQLPSAGQTIIEKLEKYANADVGFAVVLATPDDDGFAVGKECNGRFVFPRGRGRQIGSGQVAAMADGRPSAAAKRSRLTTFPNNS